MLTLFIERLLLRLLNARLPGPGRARWFRFGRRDGLRDGLARAAGNPSETPVVLGERIPTPAEALRGDARPAPVTLDVETRRRHLYVLGNTGCGKSNLLVQILQSDVEAGRAVCLLDARGDLVDRVLRRLAARYAPEDLAGRLLLVDLRAGNGSEPVIGFNPLAQAGGDPYTRAFFVLDVLRQQLGTALGVQTEETLRNCLIALAMAGGTLLDVEPMLTCAPYRERVLADVADPGVLRFFARFAALPEASRVQWTTPVLNKTTPWLARPALRRLLGQRAGVNLREFLDGRPDAICLCCLGADELFQSSLLVGSLVTNAVASCVMRTDRPVRHPLFLYLDEFENFGGGERFAAIIAEGRRFGLGLTLAHQASGQIEPGLRGLIRNVVNTQLYFATGGLDAELLAGEIPMDAPRAVVRNLLMSQAVGEALVVRRGQPVARMRTRHSPDPPVDPEAVAALRRAAFEAYGLPPAEVDAELEARDRLIGGAIPPSAGAAREPGAGASRRKRPVRAHQQEYEVEDDEI